MLPHSVDSQILQSTASSHFNQGNNDHWCTDVLPDFLDFPMSSTCSQLDANDSCSIGIPSEEVGKGNDWQDWADQLITDNNVLTADWNGLLADASVAKPGPKVEFISPCMHSVAQFVIFLGLLELLKTFNVCPDSVIVGFISDSPAA